MTFHVDEYKAAAGRYRAGMPYRRTGRSGLKLPAISLGLWQNFGDDRPERDPARDPAPRLRPRRHALRPGQQLRPALRPAPRATSAATSPTTSRPTATSWSSPPRPATTCGPGPTARAAARASTCSPRSTSRLKRMGLDYVDIFYTHRFDPETPARGDDGGARPRGALGQGAVRRHLLVLRGRGPGRRPTIARDLGTPLLIHQPSYSMLNRWIEADLLDELEEQGMGCIVVHRRSRRAC